MSAKGSSVVEINGHRYDAATGKLIGVVNKATATITPITGQVMDGFVRRPVKALVPKPVSHSIKQAAHNVHKKTSRSQTLMRSVVSKPKLKSSPQPAPEQPLKRRPGIINSKRLFRAKTVLRSPRIGHFKPGDSAKEGEVIQKTMAAKAGSQTKAMTRPLPSLMASVSHNQLERMLDHALARADAHKQALKRTARGPLKYVKRLPRWLNAALALAIIMVVGGFVAWQKVPALSLKLASSKAHVAATMPDYTPYGFSLAGPVKADSDSVSMTYKSKADGSKAAYTVTQKTAASDNKTLPQTILPAGAPTQTNNDNNSKSPVVSGVNKDKENVATCVSDGKQVIVTGGSDINETQKVASSLCH